MSMSIYECISQGYRFFVEAYDENDAEFIGCGICKDECKCIRRVSLEYAGSTELDIYLIE